MRLILALATCVESTSPPYGKRCASCGPRLSSLARLNRGEKRRYRVRRARKEYGGSEALGPGACAVRDRQHSAVQRGVGDANEEDTLGPLMPPKG